MTTVSDDWLTEPATSSPSTPQAVASNAPGFKIKRKRPGAKSQKERNFNNLSDPLDGGAASFMEEGLLEFTESPQKGLAKIGEFPQKTEPLLEQIYDIVNKMGSKQQVQYEDLLSKVNGVGAQLSEALELRGTTSLKDAVGDGCFTIKEPTAEAGGLQSLSVFETEKSSSSTRKKSSPAPPPSKGDAARKTTQKDARKDAPTPGRFGDCGTLYVKISVQAVNDDEWRCPADMTSTPTAFTRQGSTVMSSASTLPREASSNAGNFQKASAGKIFIHIQSARSLKNSDVLGKSDPYCVCAIGNGSKVREQFQTKVVNDTLDPGWNEEHEFQAFNIGDVLHFSVKDKDKMSGHDNLSDEILGNCRLNYDQFFPNGFFGPLTLTEEVSGPGLAESNEDGPGSEVSKLMMQMQAYEGNAAKAPSKTISGTLRALNSAQKDTTLDFVMAFIITLNAVLIGISMDYEYDAFAIVDVLFTISFIVEMLLKFHLQTIRGYFSCRWHIFDFIVILTDLSQLVLSRFVNSSITDETPSAAMFRMLRLARLMRLTRLVNLDFFDDLVAMISGIMGGVSTLGWAVVLFLIVVYVTSLMFREFFGRTSQIMICEECGDVDITEYFNSVPRSMLTVFRYFFGDFSTVQGVSIYEGIQTSYGALAAFFVCIVFFIVFIGIFNVITAIFVESTLAAAQNLENTRMTERLNDPELWMSRIETLIRKLFEKHAMSENLEGKALSESLEALANEPVVEEEFQEFIKDKCVVRALDDLEIDKADHKYLFDILDADNTGSISLCEFIEGFRRLRGSPRRSDIITIDLMVREIQAKIHDLCEGQESIMALIEKSGSPLRV